MRSEQEQKNANELNKKLNENNKNKLDVGSCLHSTELSGLMQAANLYVLHHYQTTAFC